MKFLERFALVVYSYIILILAIILSLVIFNWIDIEVMDKALEALVADPVASKAVLAINVLFMVLGFDNVRECNTKIDINSENGMKITLLLVVNENVIIKELASNLQNKIKAEIKKVSDLEVQEVNVKIEKIQETQKSNERE